MRNRREVIVRNQKIALGSIAFAAVIAVACLIMFGTTRANAALAEVSYKYYTSVQIEDGDTLWELADSYMTEAYSSRTEYIDEVCSINHISQDDIHAGQYLMLPYYSSEPEHTNK